MVVSNDAFAAAASCESLLSLKLANTTMTLARFGSIDAAENFVCAAP